MSPVNEAIINPPPPEQARDPLRVKVKVKCDKTSGEYTITSTHPIGTLENIEQHFPTVKMVSRVRQSREYHGSGIRDIMKRVGTVISTEIWATAIASEIMGRLSQPETGEVELSAIASGAYLALDKSIYRLTPVQCIPTNKALALMRRRVKAQCEAETTRIIAQANEQARAVTAQAAERMAEATRLRNAAQQQDAQNPRIPPWAVGIPIQYIGNGAWRAGFTRFFPISHFEYKWHPTVGTQRTKRWNARPVPRHYLCTCWLTFNADGTYNSRNCGVDGNFVVMPHIKHDASCMDIPDRPILINSVTAVATFASALVRCMQTIELNSLFNQAPTWPEIMQEALPPRIKDAVMAQRWSILTAADFPADYVNDVTDTQEAAETWTTR